jgi:hypothetical protein
MLLPRRGSVHQDVSIVIVINWLNLDLVGTRLELPSKLDKAPVTKVNWCVAADQQ